MTADAIVPDDKDWTWVLHTRCEECAFDVRDLPVATVAPMMRDNAVMWASALDAPDDELRRRPRPDKWSTLEYAAHVRDVYALFKVRLALMIDTDDPLFENWNQDVTAEAERYNEQDPETVSRALVEAADALADDFDALSGEQWSRVGRRSDGAAFTVDTFARYLLHDPVHHLWDIGAVA